ncbi:MAG: bifunctional 5,10-methylenetetrahydrofolate dehydrogenase/5,10-methenyltetrahydrofolate cyclohydrolase [Chlamydiia bacterium]|nr:bifunctional 5,10-methylenetetrahydrofolate dehydrogenase/5,10-methenyltetrahydrofolate cyclohydrolase [Chlamydiia bacterium]
MILDGRKIAAEIRSDIKIRVREWKRKPAIAFVLVGGHAASVAYVNAKKKACAEVGIGSVLLELADTVTERELVRQIEALNKNEEIDGILVQLPLPKHISNQVVATAIVPEKDVDGLHPMNAGKLLLGEEGGFIPCTPLGIHVLLQKSQIGVSGKHVVIVGRGHLVGKPLAALWMQKRSDCNATVTVVHRGTENLAKYTRDAEILVAAMGQAHFIRKEMIRPKAVVVDVGINRLANGKLVGDVDYDEVSKIASHITPVPGGVGPMTIAMLLENTMKGYMQRGLC